MSTGTGDNAEIHAKITTFLSGEFARKEGRQCVRVDLDFSPGGGFKDVPIRKWVRADEPEMFDGFVNMEKLVTQILEIATGEADNMAAGKHKFVVRTHQHLGGVATSSFALLPNYTGGDEPALIAAANGAGRPADNGSSQALGMVINHAGQLMRTNSQMFEGSIRVLGAQNQDMRQENAELRAENILLRREVDEARSNKMDREFQIAMAAEKNARTNAGFQKLLQIGTVVAAKIGGGDEGSGGAAPIMMLAGEFGKSLRPDQKNVLTSKALPLFMNALDMGQKIMCMELMKMFVEVMNSDTANGSGSKLEAGAGAPAS